MVLLVQVTDTIHQLEAVKGHRDHQAAQIIILLLLEDIPLPPMHQVHRAQEAQHGPHNKRDSWDLQVGLQMDQLHHLHRVLMKCTTGQDGHSQAMEVHDPHIQVKTLRVMEQVQEQHPLQASLPVYLQEVPLLRAHTQYPQVADLQHKANLRILDNLLIQINFRYVKLAFDLLKLNYFVDNTLLNYVSSSEHITECVEPLISNPNFVCYTFNSNSICLNEIPII